MIELVVFDLWQTLAYRDSGFDALSEILKKTNSKIPRKEFVKIFERSLQTRRWGSKYDAYSNLCKNMNAEVNDDNVNFMIDIRTKDEAYTKLYPHVIPMLETLKNQNYKIGLLSNSSIWSVEQIKAKTKLLDYIDYPLFSFDVGTIKPDLMFFRKMLEISGKNPENTIMIGDKMEDDVLPARKVGMNAIDFRDYERLKEDLNFYGIKI
jgi:HAD superfamily hydrolase (TIGR01509 family)